MNVYTKSVKDEHDPRGPEGPYRFTDRSVPVLVIKKWDGETLKQQLGFVRDVKAGTKALARTIEKAAKDNGPIAPPKALRPLLKAYAKAEESLAKKRVKRAVSDLRKVVKAGDDSKKFADGPPEVANRARAALDRLQAAAEQELDAIEQAAADDPVAARKRLKRIAYDYGSFPTVRERAKRALEALPNDKLK